jgi:hypothetical protein
VGQMGVSWIEFRFRSIVAGWNGEQLLVLYCWIETVHQLRGWVVRVEVIQKFSQVGKIWKNNNSKVIF